MFDVVFGGKKKLNLTRELVEQRMRSSGFDDLESRLQVKNLSNFQLSGTPEAAIISIIEVTLKLQKKNLFLSQILVAIEKHRERLGSEPDRFNQILQVTQSPNVEQASTAVFLYCIYRVDIENTGFPISDAQIAKTTIQAMNALSGFTVFPPDVVDDILDSLQGFGDEKSLFLSSGTALASDAEHLDEEFDSEKEKENEVRPVESIVSTCSKCSEEYETHSMFTISSELFCEACNKTRIREVDQRAREEEQLEKKQEERLAIEEQERLMSEEDKMVLEPIGDEELRMHSQAFDELEKDEKHKGIWARAFSESDDDVHAEKLYIKMRVEHLMREEEVVREKEEKEEKERIALVDEEQRRQAKVSIARKKEARRLEMLERQREAKERQKAKEEERRARNKERQQAREEQQGAVRMAELQRVRQSPELVMQALNKNNHRTKLAFWGGFKVTGISGEKFHMKTFSDLQKYYDKYG
jgi:hypothetical protein